MYKNVQFSKFHQFTCQISNGPKLINISSEHLLGAFSVNSQNNSLNLPEISAINDTPIADMAVEEVIKDISDNLKLKKSAGFDLRLFGLTTKNISEYFFLNKAKIYTLNCLNHCLLPLHI